MDDVTLLDQHIEDRYIRAILEYPRLLEITAGELSPTAFSTKPKARLFSSIIFYWEEFESIPAPDLLEVTIGEMYSSDQARLITRLSKRIWKIPPPEWRWIVAKIDEHIKTIQIQKALFETSELLKQGSVKDAQGRLVDVIRNSGILSGKATNDLDLTRAQIYEIVKIDEAFCCPTRIYALDDHLKGLFRKELFLVMAPMNVGKSWAVLHIATSALLSGKHVLYLTLEMSKERVMQRILQNISGTYTPSHDEDLTKTVQIWDEQWNEKEDHVAKSLFDTERVLNNVQILKRFGGMLSVREYPSGTATVSDIEKEVTLYDVTFSKLPDVIIIDGLPDIKFSGNTDLSKQRLGLTQVARELRRIASDYNASVVVTHQGNRDSIGAEVVGTQHTGESIGIVQVADTGISLNQTRAEQQVGTMRINVMRARHHRKWGLVKIWQNLEIGQFCQASEAVQMEIEEEEEEKEKGGYKNAYPRKKVRRES